MNSTSVITEFQRASKLTGIFTRVAKKLEVSTQHVREVALGNRRSDRVMKALQSEMRKVVKSERAA